MSSELEARAMEPRSLSGVAASVVPQYGQAPHKLAPTITQADLDAFHRKHFSGLALDHFSYQFTPFCENPGQGDELEDDGLGYYADGVKRTLTDEQIEIFRHSELETLRRKNIHHSPGRTDSHESAARYNGVADNADDMEGDTDTVLDPRKRKKKKRGKGKNRKSEVKVDLRKRTWDVVDAGLHSLDYGDDQPLSAAPTTGAPKRRHVSYDDG